ncbi:MAG: hypothetical protein AVDCRST_MAG32-2689 [uncultured Nocardioides sp.]|uniref:Uncharacterized protein n=1 Tax=uncultured Nocardioides sp. TaxID=198441 RepID=A0A6J4NW08_9ACTN|nr:MAG: hypothetical protein AVDCRST_MAG32-2689 [uncultured Nocardioides sp.]
MGGAEAHPFPGPADDAEDVGRLLPSVPEPVRNLGLATSPGPDTHVVPRARRAHQRPSTPPFRSTPPGHRRTRRRRDGARGSPTLRLLHRVRGRRGSRSRNSAQA